MYYPVLVYPGYPAQSVLPCPALGTPWLPCPDYPALSWYTLATLPREVTRARDYPALTTLPPVYTALPWATLPGVHYPAQGSLREA